MAPQQLSISFKQQLLLTAIAISVAITASVLLSALIITRFIHPESMQSFLPTANQSAYQQPMNTTTNQNAQSLGSCTVPQQQIAPAQTTAATTYGAPSQYSLTSWAPHHYKVPANVTTNVNSQTAASGQSSSTQSITNNTTNTTNINSGNVVGSYNSHDVTKNTTITNTDSFNKDSGNTVVIKDNGNIASFNKVTTNVDSNNTAVNSGNTVTNNIDKSVNNAIVDKSALVQVNQS
jgi:hypothetical protein